MPFYENGSLVDILGTWWKGAGVEVAMSVSEGILNGLVYLQVCRYFWFPV